MLIIGGLAAAPAAADKEGFFGFSQQVSVTWLLNVESAVVNHVEPSSPADLGGIKVGDHITEVEGCAIPGCGAYKAEGLMEKNVGETLRLKLRRPEGAEYAVVLTAQPPPSPSSREVP